MKPDVPDARSWTRLLTGRDWMWVAFEVGGSILFIICLTTRAPVWLVAATGVCVAVAFLRDMARLTRGKPSAYLDSFLMAFDLDKMRLTQNVGRAHDPKAHPWSTMVENSHYDLRPHLYPPVEESPEIRAVLDSKQPVGRAQAAILCGILRDDEAVPKLLRLLGDPDADTRFCAAIALSILEPERWDTAAQRSSDSLVSSYSRLCTAHTPISLPPDDFKVLREAISRHRNVLVPLVNLLGRLEITQAQEAMLVAASAGYSIGRVCECFHTMHGPAAIPILRAYLQSDDETKVIGALYALKERPEPELMAEASRHTESKDMLIRGLAHLVGNAAARGTNPA